ncbi:MAG: 1-deoxy-D-xylulose-5-phosphate synthase N-terminal domain-containing protein, partial [Clostridia bacterium]|nr:1-deoxy-D-xylulose-5-phosphate synthase N-terminal domain-containing protein [Clostridia bacterium]
MNNKTGNILDSINKPADIKNLEKKELQLLADELRHELISNVSNNGGHLASNLGVVELTIALLNVFDMENDKIIWDVGHQSYSYKILTGRRNQFDRIRKKGGISGFPKRDESKYDHFNTGHSSTSISAALGYARAAKIKGEDFYSIAVVGDGAMTGGMAFEALNDAGASDENIIVILNDNEMSITRNVGGFAEYFSRMRSNRLYSGTNRSVKKGVERIPLVGKLISGAIHRGKSAVKYLFAQNMLFEEMGFHYLGPVDGHDLKKLNKILLDAKKIKGPVLVHAVTIKGKGYVKAEEKPDIYHG